ncbi:hypothetical protein, partial [Paenibacillus sp. Marseille-Q9583]
LTTLSKRLYTKFKLIVSNKVNVNDYLNITAAGGESNEKEIWSSISNGSNVNDSVSRMWW